MKTMMKGQLNNSAQQWWWCFYTISPGMCLSMDRRYELECKPESICTVYVREKEIQIEPTGPSLGLSDVVSDGFAPLITIEGVVFIRYAGAWWSDDVHLWDAKKIHCWHGIKLDNREPKEEEGNKSFQFLVPRPDPCGDPYKEQVSFHVEDIMFIMI